MQALISYCICGQVYDGTRFMIQCDYCKQWFHGSCIGVSEIESYEIDKYYCPTCSIDAGPSVLKERTNWHRHDPTECEADSKSVQTGTKVFIDELKGRHFPSSDGVVKLLTGYQLSVPYLEQNGFNEPILIRNKDGLGMTLPPSSFSLEDILTFIGADFKVDVIDVTRQRGLQMKLGDFLDHFIHRRTPTVLNVISLEFSKTAMAPLVEAPKVARELDWVNYAWPDSPDVHQPEILSEENVEQENHPKPEIQKYCLIGMENSYTDFHVDFGGSSVWYHILWGQKIFYLIKPTQANLSLYQRWMTSSTQSEMFFADQVDACYRCVMNKGETMLIPTGWIHAVLTPVDTLVFGGNFIHSLNIPMQLQVYEIEKRMKTPGKYRFPSFETTNWYAAQTLLEEIKSLNNQGKTLPSFLLNGIKALLFTLKQWKTDIFVQRGQREVIPNCINSQKLLKDLNREIRHAERVMNLLNPPKPERESKRKKKKPVNKDFVDYSQSQLFDEMYEPREPLKLTIKTPKSNNHSKITQSSNRPSLKLTLPKPVTYPYSTNAVCSSNLEEVQPTSSKVLSKGYEHQVRTNAISNELENHHVKYLSESELNQSPVFQQDSHPQESTILKLKLQKQLPVKSITDVYDFHDDSDEKKDALLYGDVNDEDENDDEDSNSDCLYIKLTDVDSTSSKSSSIFKSKRGLLSKALEDEKDLPDNLQNPPKCSIDDLLKASGYAQDSAEQCSRLEELESGRTSPSTREAIAGMLSISRAFMKDSNNGKMDLTSQRLRRKKAHFSDDYGENIDKVHQDEEYIYPALDTSDDEDLIFKPRGKRKMDEAWSPKARVGPLMPKTDRPTREGTRKQSVEKGLEAAAAKRAGLPNPKRPYNKKKTKHPTLLATTVSIPSTSLSTGLSNLEKKIDLKNKKPKKGMATAKQRLGKILKIHKMKF